MQTKMNLKRTVQVRHMVLVLNFIFIVFNSSALAQWLPLTAPSSMPIYRTGKVGIGFSAQLPSTAKELEVNGDINITGDLFMPNDNSTGTLHVESNSLYINKSGSHSAVNINSASAKDFFVNGGQFSVFNNNGNYKVGIGITQPSQITNLMNSAGDFKLAVEGTIGAREIIITDCPTWCDFVFEKDYNLMPLTEVEMFIAANKHLPDIPSAAEVKDNGIAVGEMQTKLLQKIEELTLYIIEENKKVEEQFEMLRELENRE